MAVTSYYDQIVLTLKGETPELAGTPYERLDWSGPGALLNLYGRTSGQHRDEIIRAMGQILEEATQPPAILAQVLHIAANLDLAQIEPSVQKLRVTTIAAEEPVKSAVKNYFAFRNIYAKVHQTALSAGV